MTIEEWVLENHRVILGRVICNWVASPVDSASQIGSWGRVIHTSSKPPFKPSGYTTSPPKWRSWQTSSWLSHPQALLLGAPSTKMLMCLASERGMCCKSTLTHTKAWCQSSFVLLVGQVSSLPLLEREEGLDWDEPTPPPGWPSSLPLPLVLVPRGGRPYHIGASLGSATLLPGRWQRGLPWLSLRLGITLERDRYHVIPRWP